jgi:spermidine/putrescine transport system permease protein
LVGIALGRYRFAGHASMIFFMFATISSPELVMGASLLSFFVSTGLGLGVLTISIAHIMFSISFVAVVVRARVLTLDRYTEEAARDLGAGPWSTFWLVTFPMIFPAVLSGGLLAFALSIDDFVITNFTAGTTVTFPLWIWGVTRVGIPPQVNIMGTLIFLIGALIAIASAISSRRQEKK